MFHFWMSLTVVRPFTDTWQIGGISTSQCQPWHFSPFPRLDILVRPTVCPSSALSIKGIISNDMALLEGTQRGSKGRWFCLMTSSITCSGTCLFKCLSIGGHGIKKDNHSNSRRIGRGGGRSHDAAVTVWAGWKKRVDWLAFSASWVEKLVAYGKLFLVEFLGIF